MQVNPVVRNSAGDPDQAASFTKQGPSVQQLGPSNAVKQMVEPITVPSP